MPTEHPSRTRGLDHPSRVRESAYMTHSPALSVCGEVERPACLALAELRTLMDAELVADFHCREGWSRLGERWRGVRLSTLLALAGAPPGGGLCHGRLRRVHGRAHS